MICKKDVENGKAFWVAAISSRVVLPNGEEAVRKTYEPNGWYLLGADDEYWLYFVEDIHHVNYAMGARMVAYPVKKPYAIYDKSKYEYELKDNSIVISEKKTIMQSFLKVTYRGRAGVKEVLNDLEEILESFTDEKLTSLQYELDMFREDFDDFLTPEQVEWFDRVYDTVSAELDARWLLKKLEERHIVRIERS
jgi:hypothetical protein